MSRGVPGLILQMLFYAVPLMIFIGGLQQAIGEKLFAAPGGTLMTAAYMTYSLAVEN